jgi:serine/threonine protein kinase/tetratricopeptide (TPR) repeat protein
LTQKSDETRSRAPGRLTALRNWLFGREELPVDGDVLPKRVGPYEVIRKLGQGGMGIVYAARDPRLQRTVAIKKIAGLGTDDTARKRFWREARAAASVNHPNVCQIHEVGEEKGEPFLAMELLEGESLAERLRKGAMTLAEAAPVGLGILSALAALHDRGLVHRDLKPSNVFLTPHGVKLLDFGLARPSDAGAVSAVGSDGALTATGVLVGTPRYMAPEQVTGDPLDGRTDLFATGAILFELLAGRPAFVGKTVVALLHATLHEQPPALTGSPAVAAVDRVIRRALAKAPADRYPTAAAMRADFEAAVGAGGSEPAVLARPLTRIVVLPFRPLRPDPDTDFLAFSLPDAIATSLSGIASLVVRSGALAARFGGESPDLKAIATEADVDLVVLGTILRAGEQLRATTQLVEAPAGTLVASHTAQSPVGDLFQLEDDLTRRLVEAISLPLAAREGAPKRDVPRSARAYELYLRGNEVSRSYDQMAIARDLYLGCLEEDPDFAPAWARLARCHRVIGKWVEDGPANRARAEEAFERALDLNPDLTLAHKLYAHHQAEDGRAQEAMVRLVQVAKTRRDDPELFAGLVHACRYCGLFEASVAAHEEARRLDPHIPTSLGYTLLVQGDLERLAREPGGTVVDQEPKIMGLAMQGQERVALELLHSVDMSRLPAILRLSFGCLEPFLQGKQEEAITALKWAIAAHVDPEPIFLFGVLLSRLGARRDALEALRLGVEGGFLVASTLERDPNLAALKGDEAFKKITSRARDGHEKALAAFRDAGGHSLLGLP